MADDSTTLQIVLEGVNTASETIDSVESSLSKLGAVVAGGLMFEKLKEGVASVVEEFEQSQNAMAQIGNSIANAGANAQLTSQQAEDLAVAMAKVQPVSKDTVLATEAVALKFRAISSDEFPKVIQLAADMSAKLGMDMPSAMQILGRSLENPAMSSRALSNAGIQLTESLRSVLKQAQATGDVTKAQTLIIGALSQEMNNASLTAGGTFSGQLKVLQNNIDMTKEKIGGMIVSAIEPLVSKATEWIGNNQQLAVSLAVTGGAILALGATITTVVGVVGLLVAVVGGPLTLAFAVLAAVAGTIVFHAMQNFQKQMQENADKAKASADAVISSAKNQSDNVTHYTSQQMQSFQDLNDQVAQNARDFEQSMAQIKQTHEKTINDLKSSISDENNTFDKANAQRTGSYTDSLDQQKTAHEKKVRDIQDQIDQETAKSWLANQQTLADLKKRLADENDNYTQSVSDTNEKYQQDTQNAKDQHDKKLSDLQKQLDTENAFMTKHSADLANIRAADALDEIEKLKQSHADQMAQFDKQRARIKASGGAAGTDYQTNFLKQAQDAANSQVKPFGDIGTGIGQDMGNALVAALKKAVGDFFTITLPGYGEKVANAMNPTSAINKVIDLAPGIFNTEIGWLKSLAGKIPGFAGGIDNFAGGMAYVHKDEVLTYLPPGTSVTPAGQTPKGMGGHTFNINNTFVRDSDPTAFLRDLSMQLAGGR